jgi:hypothetical protein
LDAIERFANDNEVTHILEPEEFNVLFPVDIEKLIEVRGSVRNAAFFIYTTGVRIGRAQALTWEMPDSKRRSVVIDKGLQNSGKIGRGKTKTPSIVPYMENASALFTILRAEGIYFTATLKNVEPVG